MSAAASEPHPGRASIQASARVAELFERHGRMALGICRTMLRDAHEAEDATQQTFLSVHRALLAGTTTRDAGAWIATIARNECRARIVARMRTPVPHADDVLGDVPHGRDDVERRRQAEELVTALGALPERQREAVVLRYVHGLRYGEVATALGLSRPATEALLFRARRAMRLRLRHVSGAALVVPLSLRSDLAATLPGFDDEAGAAAGVGFAGGLFAKLAAAPTAAKIATAAVAASAVGAIGTVETSSSPRDTLETARALEATPAQAAPSPVRDAVLRAAASVTRDAGASGIAEIQGGTARESEVQAASRSPVRGPGGVSRVTVEGPVEVLSGEDGSAGPASESAPQAASSGDGSATLGSTDSSGDSVAEAVDSAGPTFDDTSVEADRASGSDDTSSGDTTSASDSSGEADGSGSGGGSGSSGPDGGSEGPGS